MSNIPRPSQDERDFILTLGGELWGLVPWDEGPFDHTTSRSFIESCGLASLARDIPQERGTYGIPMWAVTARLVPGWLGACGLTAVKMAPLATAARCAVYLATKAPELRPTVESIFMLGGSAALMGWMLQMRRELWGKNAHEGGSENIGELPILPDVE